MLSLRKKVVLLIMSLLLSSDYCLLLKNQECKVRTVTADNDYMTHILIKLKLIDVLEVVMIKITLILKFVYLILLKILV